MNDDGSIAEESEYDNKLTEAEIFAYSMVKKYDKCIAVCESTSNLWLKTYQEKNIVLVLDWPIL